MVSESICPICQELLQNESCIEAPCKHPFHRSCLIEWVIEGEGDTTTQCPICRQSLSGLINNRGADAAEVAASWTVDIERPDGWHIRGQSGGDPTRFVFDMQAADGRCAVGVLLQDDADSDIARMLCEILSLVAHLPRSDIAVDRHYGGRRTLHSVRGREAETMMVFEQEGLVGPYLVQDSDSRTNIVLEKLAHGPWFSLVWRAHYE